jgi:hypothetical protein
MNRKDPGLAWLGSTAGTRVAAAAGVLWPTLAITRLFLTGELDRPDWTDGRSEIVGFYEAADFDAAFRLGIAFVGLAYLLLLVFLAKVVGVLRSRDERAGWLGTAIMAVATVGVVATVGYLASFATAVYWSAHGGLGDDAYLVLHGLSFASYWLALPVDVLLQLMLGGAILATAVFPRWLGAAMALTGLAELAAFFSVPDAWNATSGLPYLWILVAALIMLRRPERYSTPG